MPAPNGRLPPPRLATLDLVAESRDNPTQFRGGDGDVVVRGGAGCPPSQQQNILCSVSVDMETYPVMSTLYAVLVSLPCMASRWNHA
jgi:hypothetical protein